MNFISSMSNEQFETALLYISNALHERQSIQFESRMASSPELSEAVEFLSSLEAGVRHVYRSDEAQLAAHNAISTNPSHARPAAPVAGNTDRRFTIIRIRDLSKSFLTPLPKGPIPLSASEERSLDYRYVLDEISMNLTPAHTQAAKLRMRGYSPEEVGFVMEISLSNALLLYSDLFILVLRLARSFGGACSIRPEDVSWQAQSVDRIEDIPQIVPDPSAPNPRLRNLPWIESWNPSLPDPP